MTGSYWKPDPSVHDIEFLQSAGIVLRFDLRPMGRNRTEVQAAYTDWRYGTLLYFRHVLEVIATTYEEAGREIRRWLYAYPPPLSSTATAPLPTQPSPPDQAGAGSDAVRPFAARTLFVAEPLSDFVGWLYEYTLRWGYEGITTGADDTLYFNPAATRKASPGSY